RVPVRLVEGEARVARVHVEVDPARAASGDHRAPELLRAHRLPPEVRGGHLARYADPAPVDVRLLRRRERSRAPVPAAPRVVPAVLDERREVLAELRHLR